MPCVSCTHKGICKYEEKVQEYVSKVLQVPILVPEVQIGVKITCSKWEYNKPTTR